MVYALFMFWWVRGFMREGLQRIQEVLALPDPDTPSESLVMARASALSAAGALTFWHGDIQTAEAYERAALALLGQTGPPDRRAFALITLANCAISRADLDTAESLYNRCVLLYRDAGDHRGAAQATMNLGLAAFERREYERARALLTEGIEGVRAAGDERGAAFGFRTLAALHCHLQDFNAAQACVRESLSIWRDTHGRVLLPFLLEAAAIVAAATGDHARGIKIAGGAAAVRDEMDTPPTPAWMRELNHWLEQARSALEPAAARQAWDEGLSLSVDATIAAALTPSPSTPRTARGQSPGSLTAREAEALRMVASGHTNKEIASQLSVSVATVERHLANVYSKIGARGRAEATALAITRGLVVPDNN
jgi:ATP/maltotriose-dependent transcriptional regulator MalT